jgi:hypothetical protein
MGVSKLEMQIDELVLYGFAPGDRFRIGEAVERELARLIGERGAETLAGRWVNVAKLDSGSFHIARGGNAEGMGRQIALAVHGGLARKTGRQ